ncbi:MAG: hypothetical protein WCG51_02270 [Elusimicrobiota bacterium]
MNFSAKNSPSGLALRRALAGLTVFCILANGLSPRFAIQEDDFAVASQIAATQSQLLQFFILATLPVSIVEGLMNTGTAVPSSRPHHAKNTEKNSANTSADYSLVSVQKNLNINRHGGLHTLLRDYTQLAGLFRSCQFSVDNLQSRAAPPLGVGLCMLLFFFLLPRSGLDDNARRISLGNFYARFVSTNRVFSLFIVRVVPIPVRELTGGFLRRGS